MSLFLKHQGNKKNSKQFRISVGRVFHQMGQHAQAINYLKQGLSIAQSINKSEEEAKIRHQLGKFS